MFELEAVVRRLVCVHRLSPLPPPPASLRWVWGSGFGVQVLGILGFGFWVLGFGFWVYGFGFRVSGFGIWDLGPGLGVSSPARQPEARLRKDL